MTKTQAADVIDSIMAGYSAMTAAQKVGAIEAVKVISDLLDETNPVY